MKRLIPIVLSLIIIGILVYSFINKNDINEDLDEEEIVNIDGHQKDVFIPDNPRDVSVYKLIDKKNLLNYLDPSEMQNYEDLVTLYISFLLESITEDPKEYYEDNKVEIKNYLGIYEYNDFFLLNEYLINNEIVNKSIVEKVILSELKKEGNLLKAKLSIKFDTGEINVNHYINYVYIDKMSYLFLYSNSITKER